MKEPESYSDFSNVEKQRNYIFPEEYPEGPVGSPMGKYTPVENKSSPWVDGQRTYSAYNYENKSFHQNLPRQMEGAHPPHDEPNNDNQPPYSGKE